MSVSCTNAITLDRIHPAPQDPRWCSGLTDLSKPIDVVADDFTDPASEGRREYL